MVKTDRSSISLLKETHGDKCLYCEKYSKNYCDKCPLKDEKEGIKYLEKKKIYPLGTVHCCGGRWTAMRKSINTTNELQSLKNLLAYIKKHG